MRYKWLMALGLSATLALAACGGDDGGSSGDSGSGSSGSSSSSSSGGSSSSSKADDNMPADFKKAMENLAKKNYTATYKLSGGGMDTDLKVAQKGDKANYTAMSIAGQGEFISITQGDTSYSCIKMGTMAGTCEKFTGSNSMGSGAMDFSVDNLVDDFEKAPTYKKVADRNIGGRDSQCWEVSDPDKWTVCISKKDGLMTLVESSEFKMELKEYSGSVDDKLFNPPYPVK